MRHGKHPEMLPGFVPPACSHMGHVNAPMILGTLGVIEVGLNALEIPHGKGGTEAAIEWLGESVSP